MGRIVRDWNNDMHFELPRVRIHSMKDFIKHYLMIVLSILTALGLEAWIEHAHHAHAAEAASRVGVEGRSPPRLASLGDPPLFKGRD